METTILELHLGYLTVRARVVPSPHSSDALPCIKTLQKQTPWGNEHDTFHVSQLLF